MRAGIDRAAERFDRGRDLRRGHALGASGQKRAGHARGAGEIRGINFRSIAHEQFRREQRQPWAFDHDNPEAVFQLRFLWLREDDFMRR